jgi:hypothetical protein
VVVAKGQAANIADILHFVFPNHDCFDWTLVYAVISSGFDRFNSDYVPSISRANMGDEIKTSEIQEPGS